MRKNHDQWDLVTVLVMFVFMNCLALHSEALAYTAALITFVVFRPRRRRLFRPSRIAERVVKARPRGAGRQGFAR